MSRAPLSEPLILRLLPLLLREWRHHPWRHAVALLAVALGVALAYSVQLINDSALAEFGAAVRSANGQPDLTLRGQRDGFDDGFFETLVTNRAPQTILSRLAARIHLIGLPTMRTVVNPNAIRRARGTVAR